MIDMVADAKFSLDDSADSRASPKIRSVAGFLRATQQQAAQPTPIGNIQFIRPAGCLPSLQRTAPSLTVARLPAANRTAIYTKLPGDIYGSHAPSKQRDGAQAALFEMLWASSGSHARSLGL